MEEKRNTQPEQLYKVLSRHLNQSDSGSELLKIFEEDPEKSGSVLAKYLQEELLEDKELANQIALALGSDKNNFNTIVTGGQVDQIVNIAKLGVLKLSIKRQTSLFKDIKQLVVFVSLSVFFAILALLLYWFVSQPRKMKGDFNIAVAQFDEVSEQSKATLGSLASKILFSSLDTEYQLLDLGIKVEVTHKNIGIVSDAVEAEKIARKTNADIVIYGEVTSLSNIATVLPRFYIGNTFRSDLSEITGQHQLAAPVDFNIEDIGKFHSNVNESMRERASILIEFTKALVFMRIENLEKSFEVIENTINLANQYGNFDGKEVLYLTASHLASSIGNYNLGQRYLNQSLELNPSYARAYIAQGNIFYSQKQFDLASEYYQRAIQIKDQPYGAYIHEKASLGMANIYCYQYQVAEGLKKDELARKALYEYQSVIKEYTKGSDAVLKQLAATAYYGSAVIFQGESSLSEAISYYQIALSLMTSPSLQSRAEKRLREIQSGY